MRVGENEGCASACVCGGASLECERAEEVKDWERATANFMLWLFWRGYGRQ